MRKRYLPFILLSLGLLSGCATHPKGLETDMVSIPCYKGMNIMPVQEEEVTDLDIDSSIQDLANAHSTLTEVDRPAQANDQVLVSYIGTVDGVPFQSAENQIFTVGTFGLIDGFTDSMFDRLPGDTYTWDTQISDTYPDESMWGKTVVYQITIHTVSEVTTPSITDSFVSETLEDVDSVAELKKDTKNSYQKIRKTQADDIEKNQTWSDLVESATIKAYPEDRVTKIRDQEVSSIASKAAFENLSPDEWLAKYHYESQDDFAARSTEFAYSYLKEVLIAEAILEQEHISVTQKDYDNWMSDDFHAALEKNHTKDNLWDMLRVETAKEWVYQHANEIEQET